MGPYPRGPRRVPPDRPSAQVCSGRRTAGRRASAGRPGAGRPGRSPGLDYVMRLVTQLVARSGWSILLGMDDVVSFREAVELLTRGTGLSPRLCRAPLAAGLAGSPMRLRNSHLYLRERVEEIASWPQVTADALPCRAFVARLGSRTPMEDADRGWMGADVTAPRAEQLDAARMWWRFSSGSANELAALLAAHGEVPLIGTVGGWVAVVAAIVDVPVWSPEGLASFPVRAEPPSWAPGVANHRLASGPGGPWVWWPSGN